MRIMILLLTCITVTGCKDLTTIELPAGIKNPREYETQEGALALYRGAVNTFQEAVLQYLNQSSMLTDEYSAAGESLDSVDLRKTPAVNFSNIGSDYQRLHKIRGQAQQALGALAHYAPDVSPAIRGHLFVLQGYAEILLADLFCSGIPLSTLDYEGDFTYHSGSTTQAVYAHALTLMDSALVISRDSVWIEHLARIGRARVLLQQAKYEEAAATVATIPSTYQYSILGTIVSTVVSSNIKQRTVADREGGNGLPYRSDPRVNAIFMGYEAKTGRPIFQPNKYLPAGSSQPVVVASGVEAQLIKAEAELHAGQIEAWLQTLNTLRTDGTFTVEGADTIWGTGIGAVLFSSHLNHPASQRGLPPLSDPGAGPLLPSVTPRDARINLLFAERAYWLFHTGQRQGDLRRLVREYGRKQDHVYPSQGLSGQNLSYGKDVTLPITMQMEGANPLFRGCLNRDA